MKRHDDIEFRQGVIQFGGVLRVEPISRFRPAGLQEELNAMLIGKNLEHSLVLRIEWFQDAQNQHVHILAKRYLDLGQSLPDGQRVDQFSQWHDERWTFAQALFRTFACQR